MFESLSADRRAALKQSFATRRAPLDQVIGVDRAARGLRPGDVVLARVVEIGQHQRIERVDGRRARLFIGDEIVVACGARYAPDQFEASSPVAVGPADLVAAGGVAGLVTEQHDRMKPATKIEILGAAILKGGRRANLADFGVADAIDPGAMPALVVAGTAMNAGKSFTVASLLRGLTAAGLKVATIKITGTGAGGDVWLQLDAGAHVALDFTDAGFGTTYRVDPAALERAFSRLLAAAAAAGADLALIELADGLRQRETAALLASPRFRKRIDGVIFAASDSMGAEQGVARLQQLGHRVAGVSGVLTRSPLMVRETQGAVEQPVLGIEALNEPSTALSLFSGGVFGVAAEQAA